MDEKYDTDAQIRDLELVDWVERGDDFQTVALRDGKIVEEAYVTFTEVLEAIIEHGPLVSVSPVADVMLFALDGKFEGDLMAIRQSGRNIRRILITKEIFDAMFGDYRGCIDHIKSNNFVESDLEIEHILEMADKLNLSATEIDRDREYSRLDVDIIASLQLLETRDKILEETNESSFMFSLGFSVGRLFSSAQNLVTLEADANKAAEYQRSYKARGKQGKSAQRKSQRLDDLFGRIQKMVSENPELSRFSPLAVAKIAAEDAAKENPELWTQGLGQMESYLTTFASDAKYQIKYRELFPKTG